MSRPPLTQRQMTEREWLVETYSIYLPRDVYMHSIFLCSIMYVHIPTYMHVHVWGRASARVCAAYIWHNLFTVCEYSIIRACTYTKCACMCSSCECLLGAAIKFKMLCRFDNASKTWTCIKKSQQILLEEYNKLLQSIPEWFQHNSLLLNFHYNFYN